MPICRAASYSGVARNQTAVLAHQRRRRPAPLLDAGGYVLGHIDRLSSTYQKLCNYTHARPDAGYGVLWQSNGPVYNNEAIKLAFFSSLTVHALCYLLVRLARPRFMMPEGSEILFELDWMPDHAPLVRAYADLFGKPPKSPSRRR